MKRKLKKESETYTFDEYKKKFSPPPTEKETKTRENPFDFGVKLAEKSLAKVRQHIRQS